MSGSFAIGGISTPYVGVQFVLSGPTLASTAVAGVIPQDNFNWVFITAGAGTSGTTGDLTDADGNFTPITLTHVSNDGFHTNTATNTNDGILFRGEDKSGSGGQSSAPGLTATYTFNNVPTGRYDLIAYIENDTAGVNANLTVGTTTNYVIDESVFAVTPSFALANNTDPNNRVAGNYVEFFGVAPTAGSITLTNTSEGGGNNTASINGFQLLQDTTPVWSGGGADANWTTNANWSGDATPPAALTFAGTTQLANNNDFAANTRFNGLIFNPTAGAFVVGGNAINLGGDIVDNSTSPQTVNLNLAMQADTNFNAASGDIAVGGSISGAFRLTKLGSHTLTLTGANGYGATTVSAGTLVIGAPGALPANTSVTINSGAMMQLAANTGGQTVWSLTINGSAALDITNNQLIINYGSAADPIAQIAEYIRTGYNGGNWNGPGIISSEALTNSNGLLYGVGYADGADGIVSGLTSGQIEVMYTLLGDANLDGIVNSSDFNILAANFNQSITGWDQGDFNYDGIVNSADFNALAANFNQGGNGGDVSASDVAALDAFAAANGLSLQSVPEPGSAGITIVVAMGLVARRRRRASGPGI
jgi:autotransporter-associated beta strand protein